MIMLQREHLHHTSRVKVAIRDFVCHCNSEIKSIDRQVIIALIRDPWGWGILHNVMTLSMFRPV